MRPMLFLAAALAVLAGCTKEAPPPGAGDQGHAHGGDGAHGTAPAASSHGVRRALGRLTVGGHALELTLLGEGKPGAESGLEAHLVEAKGVELSSLNLYAWVEDAAGDRLSAPDKAKVEGGALHFHLLPRAGSKPERVVVRLRAGEQDERASLPLSGHGHEHAEAPHGGVAATFADAAGKPAGHLELKLHDDKGDLELWLTHDAAQERPFDLPLAAVIRVRFIDVGGREVEMRARNHQQNEDEDGKPNVRDGKTNYFVFPGSTGADSTWLMGAQFSSIVTVSFRGAGGEELRSEELVLKPHVH